MEGNTLAAVKVRFAARKRGVESTLEEAEMNEKGYIYNRESFQLQTKMHVWQPGSARTW